MSSASEALGPIRPRPAVLALSAYRAPLEGRRDHIRLDFNENTQGVGPWLPPWLQQLPPHLLDAYPEYGKAVTALAAHLGVTPDQVLLTNGSDEALHVLALTFIEPGQGSAVVSQPTFDMIPHYVRLMGGTLTEVPVTPALALDLPAWEQALDAQRPTLAVIASPDNPTGATIAPETVADWCRRFPETLFVVDEAYGEYVQDVPSALTVLDGCPNLLVTRTFSKAWGLAGLRLGVVVGHPTLIDWLRRVRSPFSVNTLAVETLRHLLPQASAIRAACQEAMRRKTDLMAQLEARGYRVHPGAGNFYLLSAGLDAARLCDWLSRSGILVRNRSHLPQLWGMIRVSVGTEAENAAMLAALDAFRQAHALVFDLDDTLIDCTGSFDPVVLALVKRYGGAPASLEELTALRLEGGYNDDWDATQELLRRRGVPVDRDRIESDGRALYLTLAPQFERLHVPTSLLETLGKRYRLFIFTGRHRGEYDPLWSETIDPLFERVWCRDDDWAVPPKPSPDGLLRLTQEAGGLTHCIYIGNSVDDMRAATAAGWPAIGVVTTQPADALQRAGASQVIPHPQALGPLFGLTSSAG